MQQANVRVRIPGFLNPDTESQFEGYVEAGNYSVLEVKTRYPNEETDYVRIYAPHLGDNDTWICRRWKNQIYADVVEFEPPPRGGTTPTEEDAALPEELLVLELVHFHGFRYDRDRARYPKPIRGVSLPMAPPYTNNCCTFVEALVIQAWQAYFPEKSWSPSLHHQMMIMSRDDYYSPVTALIESEIARSVSNHDSIPAPWSVIQGWREQWRGGHTFIVVDHDPASDRVLTLECNSSYGLDGVGFRALGNLRDFGGKPPPRWWEVEDLWTWQRICGTYRYRKQATLSIASCTWSNRV